MQKNQANPLQLIKAHCDARTDAHERNTLPGSGGTRGSACSPGPCHPSLHVTASTTWSRTGLGFPASVPGVRRLVQRILLRLMQPFAVYGHIYYCKPEAPEDRDISALFPVSILCASTRGRSSTNP